MKVYKHLNLFVSFIGKIYDFSKSTKKIVVVAVQSNYEQKKLFKITYFADKTVGFLTIVNFNSLVSENCALIKSF